MISENFVEDLPRRVCVRSVLRSRYADNQRPLNWNDRVSGSDLIRAGSGQEFLLLSDPGQSPPQPGWEILLTKGDSVGGYRWTLYGMSKT